jgi:hypothetical protein
MNRYAAAVIVSCSLWPAAGTVSAQSQAPAPVAPPATQTPSPAQGGQVFIEREDARETRQRLEELLRQHPPAVGEVLQRDPSLANSGYLAPYPALVAFLQQHPEIARNPSYFFGDYRFQEDLPRDRSYDMFREVTDGFGFLLVFGGILSVLVWLVRSVIDQRRWLRVSRTQAEVHTKLLDRLTNNEDLLAYIQTPAGRRFLESGPLLTDGEPKPASAITPVSRIIWALQAGVVLASLGVGFWVAESRFPEDMGEGFFIIGTLAAALGVGFVLAAGLAYVISSRFGLVPSTSAGGHD